MSRQAAAPLLRQARRLVEQAQPLVAGMPIASEQLEAVRQVLGELGGDYLPGEDVPSTPAPTP